MVWTIPPANPIRHVRIGDRTACGAKVGRCYMVRKDEEPTCRKCVALATPMHGEG